MANTTVGFDGKSPPTLLPAIGSFSPACVFTATISGTTTSESITFPNLKTIRGALPIVFDANGLVVVSTGMTVTFSGNVLTLADGGSFNLDAAAYTIRGIVWGDALA